MSKRTSDDVDASTKTSHTEHAGVEYTSTDISAAKDLLRGLYIDSANDDYSLSEREWLRDSGNDIDYVICWLRILHESWECINNEYSDRSLIMFYYRLTGLRLDHRYWDNKMRTREEMIRDYRVRLNAYSSFPVQQLKMGYNPLPSVFDYCTGHVFYTHDYLCWKIRKTFSECDEKLLEALCTEVDLPGGRAITEGIWQPKQAKIIEVLKTMEKDKPRYGTEITGLKNLVNRFRTQKILTNHNLTTDSTINLYDPELSKPPFVSRLDRIYEFAQNDPFKKLPPQLSRLPNTNAQPPGPRPRQSDMQPTESQPEEPFTTSLRDDILNDTVLIAPDGTVIPWSVPENPNHTPTNYQW